MTTQAQRRRIVTAVNLGRLARLCDGMVKTVHNSHNHTLPHLRSGVKVSRRLPDPVVGSRLQHRLSRIRGSGNDGRLLWSFLRCRAWRAARSHKRPSPPWSCAYPAGSMTQARLGGISFLGLSRLPLSILCCMGVQGIKKRDKRRSIPDMVGSRLGTSNFAQHIHCRFQTVFEVFLGHSIVKGSPPTGF